MSNSRIWLAGVSVISLSACGGGGGGSSTLSPFVSWDQISQPGQRFQVTGQALEVTTTIDPTTGAVVSFSEPVASNATVFGTLDSLGEVLESGGLSTSSGQNLTFSANQFEYGEDDDENNFISAVNATDTQGLVLIIVGDYQSFGLWLSETSSSNLSVGLYSVGATTSGSAVPTSGIANYSGVGAGRYAVAGEAPSEFDSVIGATTDFSSRSMSFTSSTSEGSAPNFSGTLNWSAGSNSFSGNVATTGSALTGSLIGSFYGPAAEEIGGTFVLGGAGGAGLLGAFGAQR